MYIEKSAKILSRYRNGEFYMKRMVVKVGTSTLTYDTGLINLRRIEVLSRVLCDLKNSGIQPILVSSGAIGVGVGKLGLPKRPDTTMGKQAAAAVGQVELMKIYSKLFGEYGASVAQVLLTKYVIDGAERENNAKNTFETLIDLGVVPIVNENDTIVTYEIEFGDNDSLSAYVAHVVNADLLVILSDIDGLYDSDPRTNQDAQLISHVDKVTDDLLSIAGGSGSNRGTGGMLTKLNAVSFVNKFGCDAVIANGENPEILYDIAAGRPRGTLFKGEKK